MAILDASTKEFIEQHRNDDVRSAVDMFGAGNELLHLLEETDGRTAFVEDHMRFPDQRFGLAETVSVITPDAAGRQVVEKREQQRMRMKQGEMQIGIKPRRFFAETIQPAPGFQPDIPAEKGK